MPLTKIHSAMVALFLAGMDSLCVLLSAFVSIHIVWPTLAPLGMWGQFLDLSIYFVLFWCVWLWAAWRRGMFLSHRKDSLALQLSEVPKTVLTAIVFSGFGVAFLTRHQPDPVFFAWFGGSALVTITLFRALLCVVLWRIRRRGYNARHVLIIGANPRIAHLASVLDAQPRFGYHLIGVLEDDEERMECFKDLAIPYLGKLCDLEKVLGGYVVDEVHVGLPVRSYYEQIQNLAYLCMGVGVSLRLVADLFPLRLATSRLYLIEDIPVLSLTMVPESIPQLVLKRLIDLLGSLALLILLSPLFVAVAIAIKLESKGPVFFSQERVGLNRRRFNMIKFRSMVADAEQQRQHVEDLNEADGPVFKIRDDPRITRVGKFIRRYSIDELPQLINVLRGEMSLAGPRPHPTKEVEQYAFHHLRRLSVKPGMTGLAQVSGRSDLPWEQCIEMDLAYIDSWNILKDFTIFLRTFEAVVVARGAA